VPVHGCFFDTDQYYTSPTCRPTIKGNQCAAGFGPATLGTTSAATFFDGGYINVSCGGTCNLSYTVSCSDCADPGTEISLLLICLPCFSG
jgi:hypothetical protein